MTSALPSAHARGPKSKRESARRSWRRVVMILLIFLGGAACGAAVATMAVTHSRHHDMQSPPAMSGHITARLAALLDLTDDQSRQVREIILRRHDALIDVRREIQPRLEAELAVLEEQIAAVLNEQQRVKWHAHAASVRAQWLPPIPESSSGE